MTCLLRMKMPWRERMHGRTNRTLANFQGNLADVKRDWKVNTKRRSEHRVMEALQLTFLLLLPLSNLFHCLCRVSPLF